jgi:phosphoenolpyruvate carboxykinase (ATP)
MSTVEACFAQNGQGPIDREGPPGERLRELARSGEQTTEYGSPVYSTRVKNRSAKNTYVVEDGVEVGVMQQAMEPERAQEKIAKSRKPRRTWISPGGSPHGRHAGGHSRCRLYVPKEYARIAYMWHNMLFPSDSPSRPTSSRCTCPTGRSA